VRVRACAAAAASAALKVVAVTVPRGGQLPNQVSALWAVLRRN